MRIVINPCRRGHRWLAHAIVFALVAAIPDLSLGQSDDSFVFDDGSVADVLITMDQVYFDDLFAPGNQYSDEERPASFAFVRGIDTVRVDSVGFRLRGNTSRDAQKKSFKVSFNTFRRGQKFMGLEKLNLNGEHNDPSVIRSKIGWDLFQAMGVVASRANHVRLFINDQYYGLYINVEHVDEQFLQRHFGGDEGNLYKCLWPADLTWLGSDADAYRPRDPERRPYDLKLRDSDMEGYDDLAQFIDVLNNTPSQDFAEAIEAVFNVNGFLRALAVTTLSGSWDSYWFLKNNYYLYADPTSGRFEYIPYDFDNIMGIWWEGIYPGLDWTTRNVYVWGHPDPGELRPLTERILQVPEFRSRYSLYLRKLLDGPFDDDGLSASILDVRSMIAGAAVADPFRPLDYGYTSQDFYDSYFNPLGGHVTAGLLPYITERATTARSQLDVIDVIPVVSAVGSNPRSARVGTPIRFTARVEDETAVVDVQLRYRVEGQPEEQVAMAPYVGPVPDLYQAAITAPAHATTLEYRVTASDPSGQVGTSRIYTLSVLGDVPVVINEFMAANVTVAADPFGDFDDWLELHNLGTTPVELTGFTLTDDPTRPDKWTLPEVSIEPGGHLVVWADENGQQGPLHANFRISRLGEFLGLYDAAGVPIDTLSFGVQADDVSYGRFPDGAESWSEQGIATPGATNSGFVGLETVPGGTSLELGVYPNPFRSRSSIQVAGAVGGSFEIYDLLGRTLATRAIQPTEPARFEWDGRLAGGRPVPAGVYVVRFSGADGVLISRTIVRIR